MPAWHVLRLMQPTAWLFFWAGHALRSTAADSVCLVTRTRTPANAADPKMCSDGRPKTGITGGSGGMSRL
jgi:hypothetical protein